MDKGDGTVKYILTGDGAGTLFLIDEKSGDIHATKRLDREEKAMYTLNAKVLDRNTNAELEPDTEFNIKIHDINDNAPKFVKEIYFASVPEMSEVGKLELVLFESRMDCSLSKLINENDQKLTLVEKFGLFFLPNPLYFTSLSTLSLFFIGIVICLVRLIGHS